MTLLSTSRATWFGHLDPHLIHLLGERATQVLDRISTPKIAHELAARTESQSLHSHGWYSPSLAQGDTGLALAHATLATTASDPLVQDTARARAITFLRAAIDATREHPLQDPGLCNGTTGVLIAIDTVVDAEPRFLPARQQLLAQHLAQIENTPPLATLDFYTDVDFDLMSGRSGTLAYLMTADRPGPGASAALTRLVTDLTWAGGREEEAPRAWRWMTNRLDAPSLSLRDESFPDNYLNAGLSHGLAGVTASLALATRRGGGEVDPSITETLTSHVAWFLGTVTHDDFGPVWPAGCAVDPFGHESPHGGPSLMAAWCYGSAGIGLALLNAGRVLRNATVVDLGIAALRGTILRDAERESPAPPTLCHGTAGLALLAAGLATLPGQQDMVPHVDRLARRLLDKGDLDAPVIYRDLEFGTNPIDQPGLLNGAAGVALVLATLTSTECPRWVNTWLLQHREETTEEESA